MVEVVLFEELLIGVVICSLILNPVSFGLISFDIIGVYRVVEELSYRDRDVVNSASRSVDLLRFMLIRERRFIITPSAVEVGLESLALSSLREACDPSFLD